MKKEIRKQVLSSRDGLPSAERARKSREIEERLFSLAEFSEAAVVMFFASFRSEVETGGMIRRALAAGKRVVLPKVKGEALALFEIRDFDRDVSPGAWNIPEPREAVSANLGDIDLIILPGVAFDGQGNRLGYGAGFYDKLLPAFRKTTVALAFEVQIVPRVPVSPHDIPVRKIVTEKRVITAQGA
ncbi:MAG TPA: 5-formyltetrahydrofolate cyclo-ligase [Nitrospirota bacterium]